MAIAIAALTALLVLSVGGNAVLYAWGRKQMKKPQPSYEASELFRRMMGDGAVVTVRCHDPGSFFLRSPRDSA